MYELPPVLEKLFRGGASSDDAWAAFVREYSTLLLHVARATSRGSDEAMDAYLFLLDQLSQSNCKRLRAYSVHPNSKFTTWLVVVVRRVCIDHARSRYGRVRNAESARERDRLNRRRRLEDLSEAVHEIDDIADDNQSAPDTRLEVAELSAELTHAVSVLPTSDQLLIRLRFDDGLSAAEIAEVLHYPSQFHVYRRLNAVLATLRGSLQARGFESAAS